MRPIEFRGYSLSDKEWKYGYYYVNTLGMHNIVCPDGHTWEVYRDSIGQYTGFKDKNGVKIYEGDYTDSGLMICFIDGMFIPYYDWGNQERYEDVGCDWWSDCQFSKPVTQYSLSGELIKEWNSIVDVQRVLGIKHGEISAVCMRKKHHKTAGGFIWRYKGDTEI